MNHNGEKPMKRGLSYFICANIVISIFVGGLISTTSVNAYQILNTADQLLYEEMIITQYTGYDQYWFEFEPGAPYYEVSYCHDFDNQYVDKKLHSYVVDNATDPNQVWANHTSTKYDLFNHYTYTDYYFDYGPAYDWYVSGSDDYYYYGNYNYSNYNWIEWFPAVPNVINFDFSHNFGSAVYNSTTINSYNINGADHLLTLDIYDYYYSSPSSWMSSYYDITYTHYEDYEHFIKYYVDNNTGIIVSMDLQTRYSGYYSFSEYSTELSTNVDCNVFYEDTYLNKWSLVETSVDYSPLASDIDIPGAMFGGYNALTNAIPDLSVPVYIENIGPFVTLEIFIDGLYLETRSFVPSGQNMIVIPGVNIPYHGPEYWHNIRFDIYDDYNFKYNSSWEFSIYDLRTMPPSWGPSWMEGPVHFSIDSGDTLDVAYQIYSDTNWTVDVFKHNGVSYAFYDWWNGYQNTTRWLWDTSLTVGNYSYWLHFYDNEGVTQDMYVTIDVVPADAPDVNGWKDPIYYTVGTDLSKTWQLFDNDPDSYEVKLDGLWIEGGTYFDGKVITINMNDIIFSSGDYLLEIRAWDFSAWTTTLSVMIHATGTGDTSPPVITGAVSTIHMAEGDNETLAWTISDDNPCCYQVYLDGNLTIDEPWTASPFAIKIDLNTLSSGTYFYELVAHDTYGQNTTISVEVIVGDSNDNETEEPTEPSNTLQLDAPGVVYVAIGFLSIAALTVLVRRRK